MNFRGKSGLAAASLAGIACWAALAPTAGAKTFKVNRAGDPVPGNCTQQHCTVREAVEAANGRAGADVVRLAPGKRYELEIPPQPGDSTGNLGGDLDSTDSLRIETRRTKRGRVATIDAGGIDRILTGQSSPLTVKRLALTGGEAPDCAGLYSTGARLTVDRVRVTGNQSGNNGGGVCSFTGPTKILRTVVANNTAENIGAGAQIYGPLTINGSTFRRNVGPSIGGGLGYVGDDSVRITGSRFIRNTASSGGGLAASSINPEDCPTLRVERSEFSRNEAAAGGGVFAECLENRISSSAIHRNDANAGGGIYVARSTTVVNATIAANQAGSGGGIYDDAGADTTLTNVTISGNAAQSSGGGVFSAPGGTVARNVLIALNTSGVGGPDCFGNFDSQGGNLLGTESGCMGFDLASDQTKPNPKLGKLKRNGGATPTMALRKGSPAINEGVNPAPNRDQRGVKRTGRPDVGAYEFKRRR
jgi:hypothetical protein